MDELGERAGRRLGPRSAKPSEEGEHRLGLGEVDAVFVAEPGMPPERRTAVPVRFVVEQQQDELEGVREAHVVELGGRGGERTAGVSEESSCFACPALTVHEESRRFRVQLRGGWQ